jgi:electron transfer flavoprotein alpha subunit
VGRGARPGGAGIEPGVVLATGTDRGNEVLAQAAARLDLPFSANCTEVRGDPTAATIEMTRVRWGGSLLEEATLTAPTKLVTIAHHAVDARRPRSRCGGRGRADGVARRLARPHGGEGARRARGRRHTVDRTRRRRRRPGRRLPGWVRPTLQELASELGGVVGCSRAVTNNGWRNHADQVGQTGTRIAPDVYFACGISGAIQHWVGAMASKNIIAINTDKDANMVSRAGYAVIGDLHQVVPAITAEIRRRRGA